MKFLILMMLLVRFIYCEEFLTKKDLAESLQKIEDHIFKLRNLFEDAISDDKDLICTTEENSEEMGVFLRYIVNYLKGSNKQSLISKIKQKTIQYELNWKKFKMPKEFPNRVTIQSSLNIITELHQLMKNHLLDKIQRKSGMDQKFAGKIEWIYNISLITYFYTIILNKMYSKLLQFFLSSKFVKNWC